MSLIGKFAQPDSSPTYFIDFLDFLDRQEDIRNLRAKAASRMNLAAGHRALDLGCGIGGATFPLAEITGPAGLAAGVDISMAMVEAATKRVGRRPGVEFKVGEACAIPYPGDFFDVGEMRAGVFVFAGPAGRDSGNEARGEAGRPNRINGYGAGYDRSVFEEARADTKDDVDRGQDHAEPKLGAGFAGTGAASRLERIENRNIGDLRATRVFPESDGWFAGRRGGEGSRSGRGSGRVAGGAGVSRGAGRLFSSMVVCAGKWDGLARDSPGGE